VLADALSVSGALGVREPGLDCRSLTANGGAGAATQSSLASLVLPLLCAAQHRLCRYAARFQPGLLFDPASIQGRSDCDQRDRKVLGQLMAAAF